MSLSPAPPLLALLGVLLALSVAAADETDKDTLDGMDAEVRGNWVEAAQAFARASAAAPADTNRSLRLRFARQRGIASWKPQIDQLLKENRFEDAAQAVAVAGLIDPGNAALLAAAKRIEQAGARIEALPEGQAISPLFPQRSAAGRLRAWSTLGAPFGRATKLIDGGVRFLVAGQEKEGHWDSKKHGGYESYESGVAGLALLALLVDGPGGLAGDRGAAARRAADYLAGAKPEDGGAKRMYCATLATEALAEYAAIAGDTERLRPALERARDHILEAQNPGAGWQYEPRDGKSDTSVTGRAVCALQRLRLAGIAVPEQSMRDAMSWIDSMVEPTYGQIGYNYPGGAPARFEDKVNAFPPEESHSMTAAGALITCYAGADRTWLPLSLALLSEVPPRSRFVDMYYWQLGARAYVAATGTVPAPWYTALVEAAAACTRPDGGMADCDAWQGQGGRIYATSMTVLALAAPFSEPAPKGTGTASASTFLRDGKREVAVPGNAAEVATGIYVDSGMRLTVSVQGTIQPWTGSPPASSDGIKHDFKSYKPLLKGAPFACLLGKIGPEGKPFRIQETKPVAIPTSGQLFLLVNDERPEDGSGAWTVRLQLVR